MAAAVGLGQDIACVVIGVAGYIVFRVGYTGQAVLVVVGIVGGFVVAVCFAYYIAGRVVGLAAMIAFRVRGGYQAA